MTIDERMEKIEGQLARVRWFNHCLIACIVLSLVAWFVSKTFGPDTVWAKSGVKEIIANKIILEDENGKTHVILSAKKDGAGLWMYGENGKQLFRLGADYGGATLSLCYDNGRGGVRLGVTSEGPEVVLTKKNGMGVWSAP